MLSVELSQTRGCPRLSQTRGCPRSGPVASSVNGVWDGAWRTWALVAEFSLGEECEIVPAMEMILKVVRKTSISGHHQWPDQARCDYPGVAMWFFARD